MKPPALEGRPWIPPTSLPHRQGCPKLLNPEVAELGLKLLSFFKQLFSTKAGSLS